MVYESDFYTTRRPYSRPLASSYTVTYRPITIIPVSTVIQLRSVPHMPYVAHKRLVTVVRSPIHNVYYAGAMVPIRVRTRVRPSILAAELNRIRYLPRPSTRSYIEEYLNSRDNILFDDEAREIRARVDSLLRRVHVFVPRAVASDFIEEIVPERMRSHDYVRRLLSGRSNAKKEVDYLSWYEVPDRGHFGTLACIKYVAGKPQSVRKPYYKVADLRPADIRNDVNFLSYYSKNRQAAATASPGEPMTEREMRKASESEEKPEKKAKKKPESEKKPEEEPIPVTEPVPEPISEPVPEPTKESEPIAESVKPSKPAKGSKPAKSAKSAKAVERKAEPVAEPAPELAKEPEIVKEPEPEPVQEPEPISEPEPTTEPEAPTEPVAEETPAPAESTEAVSDEANEEKVKQDKEDAMRRAEAYLAKAAREAQSEEERRKAAEEERLQLEMEERKAWEALQLAQERKEELSQILEIEQQEAERKVQEAKLQAEHEETERIEEGERLINQAKLDALIHEQERLIVEEHLEEIQNQKQEQEETGIAQGAADEENKETACADELADLGEITDQEKEEKPCDVNTDDETRVEEENVPEEEPIETGEDPFVEEPEGAESKPQTGPMAVEDGPQIEEVTSGEEFSWGDQDS
ncbi:hypothetical protein PUN28_013488 [Cardiocondyla obscurior]|uniref:Uncharacterized protein n=1 Tax=Cardiocondyla obscurior TaxID=286306 RepID=A0AAW2F1H8_9HYME